MLFKFEKHIHHHHHFYFHYPEIEQMTTQIEDMIREVQEAKVAQAAAVATILRLIVDQQEKIAQIQALIAAAQADSNELADLKSKIGSLAQELSDSTDTLADAVARTGPTEPAQEPEAADEAETAPEGDSEGTPTDTDEESDSPSDTEAANPSDITETNDESEPGAEEASDDAGSDVEQDSNS